MQTKVEKDIKKVDKIAAWIEAVQIAGYSEKEALQILKKPKEDFKINLKPMPPNEAIDKFIKRFNKLIKN